MSRQAKSRDPQMSISLIQPVGDVKKTGIELRTIGLYSTCVFPAGVVTTGPHRYHFDL
jgi:hypothetical protein